MPNRISQVNQPLFVDPTGSDGDGEGHADLEQDAGHGCRRVDGGGEIWAFG
jgi:hypothetical protein